MSALAMLAALLHVAAAAVCLALATSGPRRSATALGLLWILVAAWVVWSGVEGVATPAPPLLMASGAGALAAALALRQLALAEERARTKADALDEEQRRYVKEASSHLEASRARFRALAEAAPIGILETDRGGACNYVSRRWCELAGGARKDAKGDGWLAAVHPEDRRRVEAGWRAAVESGAPFEVEFAAARSERERWLFLQLVPRAGEGVLEPGYVGTLTDVTHRHAAERERRALETRFQRAQKLESLGLLAGGVAHDSSNLAVSILGNVHVLRELTAGDAESARLLARIETAAMRSAELSRDLLGFAGRGDDLREPVELSALTRETAELLEATLPAGVELALELDADLAAVEGDPSQLGQVALNLLSNAIDACAPTGGRVTARTGGLQSEGLSLADTYTGEPLPAGAYVFLEVEDEGAGMDEETQQRMFDPFFTTKEHGRGLGLAIVHGIVRKLRGALQVRSAVGEGTTMRVLLPTSDAPPVARKSARSAATR